MRVPGRLMRHTVAVERWTESGTYDDAWETAQTISRAHVEETEGQVTTGGADTLGTTAKVWLDPEYVIPTRSKVTIWPGTPRARTSRVLEVERLDDPLVPAHQVLHLE